MAERFEEISPVSENPECLSTDIGLPIHRGDIQHPPTKDTPGCDVLTVHPHQGLDKERVEAVAQDQDGCRSQLHPSDIPPVKPEESPDIAHPTEDQDQGLSGGPHRPGADPDTRPLRADSSCLATVAASPLTSQRPLLALHQPHEWAVRPDQGLSVAPDPSGGPTQALPLGNPHPLRTPWRLGQGSTARGYSTADAGGSGGSPPALVITQAEESWRAVPLNRSPPVGEPRGPTRPTALPLPAGGYVPGEPSPSSSDGGDMACSDLMSLRSDSISMTSDAAASGRSEESPDDDTRSMANSSVMSLYPRVQLDPLEKDWLRSSALGNICAQRLLLTQDPSLAHKKDFVTGFTALHWAAKQGRLDTVDLMFLSGVDVNVRSHGGYTALHLASIHSHQHMVLALINTYNAKTNIRDYHGKKPAYYWSGRSDAFNIPGAQSVASPDCQRGEMFGRLGYGRRSHRYPLPAMLLSRSRSQGQLSTELTAAPQSPRLQILDIPMAF